MRKIKRYIARNWFWITVGFVLTEKAVEMAYIERGTVAYGGEWLVLPLVLMAVEIARNIGDTLRYLLGMEEEHGARRSEKNRRTF